MKMNKILSTVLPLAASAFLLSSCEDNLDIAQHSVSAVDTFYSTDDEAEEAIVTCYAGMKELDSSTSSLWFIKNHLSDDVWSGGGSHYDGSYYMLGDYTFSSDFSSFESIYEALYNLIYRANLVIENVTGESSVMKRAVAEAKVFRAFANFQLVTLWGSAPLVTKTLTADEYYQANSTPAELWAQVETDLSEAISSGALSQKSSVSEKNYRVTKQFAQALLGKAYVFEEKWSEATSMLDNVINSGLYALNPDLSNAGTPAGVMTTESIYEINCINDPSQWNTNNNFKWIFKGLRGEKYSYSDSPLCSQTFGYQNPTKDLYDAFVSVEGVDGYRLKNSIATLSDLENTWGATPNQTITDNEGYWDIKYRMLTEYWGGYFYANNTRVMKYNEVLLLAAEAYFQSGNSSKALEYINLIRDRAQAPRATAIDMDVIKTESRLELCFEGQRYENLIRWGDAATALAYKGKSNPALAADPDKTGVPVVTWTGYNDGVTCGFQSGKHELWPFPANEMSVNKNLTQNPGW